MAHLLIYSLLLFFIFQSISATVCPVGWSYFDGLCWKFNDVPLSWNESDKECILEGGLLVSPKGDKHNQWISIISSSFIDLPFKSECFERDDSPAWISPRQASHLRVSSVQECQAICASSSSYLNWKCTRLVYDQYSQGCLLLGTSPGEGEKMAVDPNMEAYSNLCWLDDNVINEVELPLIEGNEDEKINIEDEVIELEKSMTSMNSIDESIQSIPLTIPTVSNLPTVTTNNDIRKCFTRIPQATIPGWADEIYQNVSASECLKKCIDCIDCLDDDLPCMSTVYYDNVSECVLLRMNEKDGSLSINSLEDNVSVYWRDMNCSSIDKCYKHMDLIVILDGSDSIGKEDFEKAKRVVQNMIGSIGKLTTEARISVYQVGDGYKEEVHLGPLDESAKNTVDKIKWIGGRSLLGTTVSHIMKIEKSETAKFILISDIFLQDNTLMIERERQKRERDTMIVSLSETIDKKAGMKIVSNSSKLIHEQNEDKVVNLILMQLCHDSVKRMKRSDTNRRLIDSKRIWIGLKQIDNGDIQWIDHSNVDDLSFLIDRPTNDKKCVSAEITWKYEECDKELPYVCTFNPIEQLESLIRRSFTITSLHMPQ